MGVILSAIQRYLNKKDSTEDEPLGAKAFLWEIDPTNKLLTLRFGNQGVETIAIDQPLDSKDFWGNLVHPTDLEHGMDALQSLKKGHPIHHRFRFLYPNGVIKWFTITGIPVYDTTNQIIKYTGSAIDTTHPKVQEAIEQKEASNHSLVPREKVLLESMRRVIEKEKEDERIFSLYYIDINRFKIVNDTYGEDVGDRLMALVYEKVQDTIGEHSEAFHIADDEFLILVKGASDQCISEMSQSLLTTFQCPFFLDHESYNLSISLGVSRYPETADSVLLLIQQAEMAMEMVKSGEKEQYHVFESSDGDAVRRRRNIELALAQAVTNKELSLVYQPKIHFKTGKVYGAEALLRWSHPELGRVSPGEFIPVAEESGTIYEIGYWVLYETIRQAKRWQEQGLFLQVSLNISPLQYKEPYFVERVEQTLMYHDLDPKYLTLEITESVMQDSSFAGTVLNELQEIGVKISIDDFGTGYSSLSILNTVNIDYLKIDKSFVDPIPGSGQSADLVRTIIQMGHNLGFELVAEGIENRHQANYLESNGCHYGQGYFYAKPLDPKEFPEMIQTIVHE